MLKKIDFQKKIQCAEPFCRNTNFAENKWRPAPASSRGCVKFCQDRQKKVEMVRSSRLLYLICYMLKKIDFQKNFECAEPFCRNINFTENKWRPAPASS